MRPAGTPSPSTYAGLFMGAGVACYAAAFVAAGRAPEERPVAAAAEAARAD